MTISGRTVDKSPTGCSGPRSEGRRHWGTGSRGAPGAARALEAGLPQARANPFDGCGCFHVALADIVVTDDPAEAFKDADAVFLVGSRPRSKGMERRDLLAANADIFRIPGRALDRAASR